MIELSLSEATILIVAVQEYIKTEGREISPIDRLAADTLLKKSEIARKGKRIKIAICGEEDDR